MESNKLKEYISKIETLDYDHYLLMTKKFGKRETNKFLKQVVKTIEENENLTDEEREFYLDNFDGYINRDEYEKELKDTKETTIDETEDLELLYKEYGNNTDLVGMYLKEISSTPLLTEDEEKKYGKDLKLKDDINIFTDKTIPEYKGQVLDIETVFSSINTEQEKNEITTLLNNYTFKIKDNENKEQKIIKYYLYEYEKLCKSLNRIPEVKDLNKYFSSKTNNKLNVFTEFNKQTAIGYNELSSEVKKYTTYMIAKNIFIKANLKLVISIAKNYMHTEVPLSDLIQEGNNGLIIAVDRFDVDMGNKFSTYAVWWIRQAITRGIADKGRTIRIPVHMVEKYNKLIRTRKRLSQEYGREATLEEVAAELNWPSEEVEKIVIKGMRMTSLDKTIGEEEDSTLGDFIPSNEKEGFDYVVQEDLSNRIDEVLAELKEREAAIIRLRYGIDDGKPKTLEEVGQIFGVTRERIRQIEAKAIRKLRNPAKTKRLKDFLNK